MDTSFSNSSDWVDVALVAVLVISVISGVLRGLVFELMSLAGWIVAYVVAGWAAPQWAPHIPVGVPDGALNHAAAMLVSFVVALLAWSVLARLVKTVISATPLTGPDRFLGGVFGLVRGVVLLLVVTTVVAMTPAAQSSAWQNSEGARWLMASVQGIKPLLPEPLARWLPPSSAV